MAESPTTRLTPSAPTAIAVTTAVDCTRLSRRHFTYVASRNRYGIGMENSRERSSATSASSRSHMRLICEADSLSMPSLAAILSALQVDTPVAYISATAAATALPTRLLRSSIPSGKYVPHRSFGMRSVIFPADVISPRSR